MLNNEVNYNQFKDDFKDSKLNQKLKVNKKNNKNSFFKFSFPKINKQLVYKIIATLFVVLVYRLMMAVPLPGINMEVYQNYFGTIAASESTYLLQIFTGGTLDSPSIVGMGLLAYINVSIIVQLLTPVIPKLTELSKEGAQGQQVINQYVRYLTLPFSIIYSIVFIVLISKRDLNSQDILTPSSNPVYLVDVARAGDLPSIWKLIFMAIILTAGTMLLVWLAEYITEKGIGNGSSIILTVGILSSLPSLISRDFSNFDLMRIANEIFNGTFSVLTSGTFVSLITIVVGGILFIYFIVFVNESIRNVELQQTTRRVIGSGNESSMLPIKMTMTGVLPIIFASSILTLPQIIVPLLSQIGDSNIVKSIQSEIQNSFLFASSDGNINLNDITYSIVFFLMILGFGLFYSYIAMKPEDIAENLQKSGRYVPGIRPGKATEKYISGIIGRIGFAGAFFLGLVALIPVLTRNLVQSLTNVNILVLSGIGGTSILIVVSVVIELLKQYQALKVSKKYEQYS